MEKEFILYEQALALKELGFDEPCLASWTYKTKERIPTLYGCGALLFDTDGLITNQTEDVICSAPLYQQAFRWFRDKYDLRIWIESKSPILFEYTIATSNAVFLNMVFEDNSFYGTYEEAELECLKKLIEIVKENK